MAKATSRKNMIEQKTIQFLKETHKNWEQLLKDYPDENIEFDRYIEIIVDWENREKIEEITYKKLPA